MKKTLLTLAALLSVAAASAATLLPQPQRLAPAMNDSRFKSEMFEMTDAARKAPALAAGQANSMIYTEAADPYQAIGFQNMPAGTEVAMAMEIPAEKATEFAGNKVSAINFYTGINTTTRINNITQYTVSLTYDLENAPFCTQEVTCSNEAFTAVTATLDNPYTVEEGKAFYAVIKCKLVNANDYPFVIDYMNHGNDVSGGWYAVYQNGTARWDNFANQFGFLCIGVTVTGDKLPSDRVEAVMMAGAPVAYQNEMFELQVLIQNKGANDINDIDISCKVGDNEPITEKYSLRTPMSYNSSGILTLTDLSYSKASEDPVTVTFTIDKVNGNKNLSTNNSTSTTVLIVPEGKGYTRNVVIEEFTGTWCGFCPTGITTMEYLREHYTDGSLIPVAVHVNGQNATDPMTAQTYQQVASLGSGNVPEAIINRSESLEPRDLTQVLSAYEAYHALPAIATISLDAAFSETKAKTLELSTTSAFTFTNNNAASLYAIAFGITENGVGPYNQNNSYAGKQGDFGGWESKGSSVPTVYNDVARQLNSFSGIKGSIPAAVEAGKEYTFSYELKLNASVKDINNINVIAYLINLKNGSIENAAYVPAGSIKAGVEDIITDADADAPVEYFNLQGVRVAEPAAGGLYIRRQGKTATKVIL